MTIEREKEQRRNNATVPRVVMKERMIRAAGRKWTPELLRFAMSR
jgi:hypothetical protein